MRFVRQSLLALSFLTRVPVRRLDLAKTDLARATVYFPLVGTLVGASGAGAFWLASRWFSTPLSVGLTLGFLMLLTGGLHEDGLADAFDAFGSKSSKADILEVMRDSRIGTYGALALIVAILLKFAALGSLRPHAVMTALILTQTIARWSMLPALAFLPYPRKSATISKQFVEAVATMPKWHLLVSGGYTLGLSLALAGLAGLTFVAIGTTVGLLLAWYFWKKIQGATGDCYGTIEQCAEVVLYLTAVKLL